MNRPAAPFPALARRPWKHVTGQLPAAGIDAADCAAQVVGPSALIVE
jgi:hypothetical protein